MNILTSETFTLSGTDTSLVDTSKQITRTFVETTPPNTETFTITDLKNQIIYYQSIIADIQAKINNATKALNLKV